MTFICTPIFICRGSDPPSGIAVVVFFSCCLFGGGGGLHFDVINKLNAHGGLFVGQKAAAAAGAHM